MICPKTNYPFLAPSGKNTIFYLMFYARLFMIASFVIGLTLNKSSAEGIAGFENLHWKMTKSQVEKIYPNFEEWIEDKPAFFDPLTGKQFPKTQENTYGLKEYYILACKRR